MLDLRRHIPQIGMAGMSLAIFLVLSLTIWLQRLQPKLKFAGLVVAILFAIAFTQVSCGGGGGGGGGGVGTVPGPYTLTLTGTSGATSRTIELALQVNQ